MLDLNRAFPNCSRTQVEVTRMVDRISPVIVEFDGRGVQFQLHPGIIGDCDLIAEYFESSDFANAP